MLLLLCIVCAVTAAVPIPVFTASGTYAQVGEQIGRQAATRVALRLSYPDIPPVRGCLSQSRCSGAL